MGVSQSQLDNFVDPGPPVTQERVMNALKHLEKTDKIVINSMQEEAGSDKGDNFAGVVTRLRLEATVDGTNKSYDWIVKSPPRDKHRHLTMKNMNVDAKEISFYDKLIPQLQEFAKLKGHPEMAPKFCGSVYAECTEQNKFLIMPNLKLVGFRDAINKKEGLDLHHVKMALRWLASYHAITYAFMDQYKGGMEQMKKDFPAFFTKWTDIEGFLDDMQKGSPFGVEATRQMVKKIDELTGGDKYSKWAEEKIAIHEDFGMAAIKVREQHPWTMRTFCHGDPWFNNIMFKYNDDKLLQELIFIDLQMVGYTSPTLDFTYFMFSSTTGELRKKHGDLLMSIYYSTLIGNITALGSKVDYSYDQFREDLKTAAWWGLNFAIGALPMVLVEKDDVPDMGEMEKMMESMNTDSTLENKNVKEFMNKKEDVLDRYQHVTLRIKDVIDDVIALGS